MNLSDKAKSISSSYHIKKSYKIGSSGEIRYYESCKYAKLKINKTNKNDDMNHVDFIVNNTTVDVKGLKISHKLGNILLEIKNVQGYDGWCSEKGPEWIAFDFGAFFLHAKNSDLIQLYKKLCNLNNKTTNPYDCLYKSYTRSGRKDLMTMVTLKDVLNNCEHCFLPSKD
jgi:hypothetical protein